MSKKNHSFVSVRQSGPRLSVEITFPEGISDAHGHRRFVAFGEDLPTALYNAARHAFESIHPKKE